MPANASRKSTRGATSKSAKRKIKASNPPENECIIELTDSDSDYVDYYPLLYPGTSGEEDSDLSSLNEEDHAVIDKITNLSGIRFVGVKPTDDDAVRVDRLSVVEGCDVQRKAIPSADTFPWSRGFRTRIPYVHGRTNAWRIVNEMRCTPCHEAGGGIELLDEDVRKPLDFATRVSELLSNQKIVVVTCSSPPKMFLDLEFLHQHFALSPDEIVAVSKCDTYSTVEMKFRDFMAKYQENELSIHDHPMRRGDMPLFLEHLDHGYAFGWRSHKPGEDAPPDRSHTLERMHASLQCYPSTFLRPHHWREMVPGTSVAIHVRAGLLILRIFCPPNPELMNDRHDYFTACDEVEQNNSTCLIVELVPGQLIIVAPGIIFDIYAPIPTMTTTTYFLNYSCLHLTEMAKSRIKFKSECNLSRIEVSATLYHTMVKMLGVIPRISIEHIPVRPLMGLCSLVAYPSFYHHHSSFPDGNKIQKLVSSLAHSENLSQEDIDPFDIPWEFRHLMGPLEMDSFTIANRFLKYAHDSGIGVPRMVCHEDEIIIDIEPDLQDYLFFDGGGPKAWSWPGFGLDDKHWSELICTV